MMKTKHPFIETVFLDNFSEGKRLLRQFTAAINTPIAKCLMQRFRIANVLIKLTNSAGCKYIGLQP
jgi:hypothetical protein